MQPHAVFEPTLAFDLTQVGATKARRWAREFKVAARAEAGCWRKIPPILRWRGAQLTPITRRLGAPTGLPGVQ